MQDCECLTVCVCAGFLLSKKQNSEAFRSSSQSGKYLMVRSGSVSWEENLGVWDSFKFIYLYMWDYLWLCWMWSSRNLKVKEVGLWFVSFQRECVRLCVSLCCFLQEMNDEDDGAVNYENWSTTSTPTSAHQRNDSLTVISLISSQF